MTAQNENFLSSDNTPINLIMNRIPVYGSVGFYRNVAKRVFDVFLVLVSAPIVVPVVLILAAFVASDGCNPFYRQKRVGKNGRIFTMWKLRTMVPNAKDQLDKHLEKDSAARLEWEEKQKLTDDPRITRLGGIIRKTSMDELPQLWNVLIGDMSLVGPRPMMPEQRCMYPGVSYYALRPGVSGFWQISDRHNSSFAARAEFDDLYNETVSFRTDLRVIACTMLVVLRGTGC
ncbi:Undecaprenyl phosphate N,N'-diacetylbacillosamine 1-phosphate transferase [Roseovarius litorisediminis]|uniref:Undecaprenyl phosphate N,N'-diacetylbacillosamine 1-phosphate transferase n=1 Tax=Roseovarius litorisediminis TaxID=1312363 RepID=A0A1Y5T5F4_9RHOB|nr:sugar transferase [Roseovarius litorisediminis]SLN55853.1 Undecaprenyl phosphate N,N'-diacetylbacillosamine 1-phosphate transferase [Roseovarius litorisediminis]